MSNVVSIGRNNEFYQAELEVFGLIDTFLLEADFAETTKRVYRLALDALIEDLGDTLYIGDITPALLKKHMQRYEHQAPTSWNPTEPASARFLVGLSKTT